MDKLKVFSPYENNLIQEIAMHNAQQAEKMLDTAQKTFCDRKNWLPVHQRVAILEKLANLMEDKKEDLAREAAAEGGKPYIDSYVEAMRAIQGVKIAIQNISQMTGTEIPMQLTASSMQRIAYTLREPVGVVFAISAFNHPLNLIVHQVIPAIATGCPVIVKPASSTPLSALKLVELLYEAGLPEAWCQVLVCKNQIAERILSDPRVKFFSFIGSGRVGWHLRSLLAPGTHCALEHGGVAPVIIEADADLHDALPLLVKGGFYHAGQVCVSVQRVFVHKSMSETFAKQMAEMAKKLKVGDPLSPDTEVGPLIDPKEVDRIHQWVEEAKQQGATLLCGGNKISDFCYQPTVLLNPAAESKVSTQEIFGPVICVYSYENRNDAIERANALPYAFQAAVFTKNIDNAFDAVKRLKANTVLINDHTAFRMDWMPFGGREESGLGVGGIPYTMRDMMHEKLWILRSSVL